MSNLNELKKTYLPKQDLTKRLEKAIRYKQNISSTSNEYAKSYKFFCCFGNFHSQMQLAFANLNNFTCNNIDKRFACIERLNFYSTNFNTFMCNYNTVRPKNSVALTTFFDNK